MSQKAEAKDTVELDRPRAVTTGLDQQSVVSAKTGTFNTEDKRLLLKNGVTFERTLGRDNYVLKTPAATVSIDEQTVVSDGGVDGAGPGGSTLKADRMNADNKSGAVVFEGNVSMRVYPKEIEKTAGADKPAPATENGDVE
jgi:LPS export ABC transporter protein LptC